MRLRLLISAVLSTVTLSLTAGNIDSAVNAGLQRAGITPSERCSDEVFCRRTFLLTTTQLPTVAQAESFINSKDSDKRVRLVDSLLNTSGWIDLMVVKFGDMLRIKSEFPSCIWPNGVQAYNRWLTVQFRDGKPYDRIVREMLCSTGSNFRDPACNFFRINVTRSPKTFCDDIALIFAGQRTHPEPWERFFTQVTFKTSREWKEEFVCLDLTKPTPGAVRIDGQTTIHPKSGEDYRVKFAEWFTSPSHRQFARAFVNRVWSWIMGRGIVMPVDDFSSQNLPSNRELLEYLTDSFISGGYDIKSLFREILTSDTYQRTCRSNASNRSDLSLFSHYIPHRMMAEEISDAICDITGNYDIFASRAPEPYTKYPKGTRSVQIGDGTVTTSELELFGRPSRDVSTESSRSNEYNYKQAIYLINSEHILSKLKRNRSLTPVMYDNMRSREDIVDFLYMTFLTRHASDKEKKALAEATKNEHVTAMCENISVALLNSDEFLFIH